MWCQVEVSATDRSLFQRSPIGCGVSWVWSWRLGNEEALTHWGGSSNLLTHVENIRLLSHGPPGGRTRSCWRLPDRKWLDDSHRGRAVVLRISSWYNTMGLGHWSPSQCPSLKWNQSAALGAVGDVRAARDLPSHLRVCGWDTNGSSNQWPVWKQQKSCTESVQLCCACLCDGLRLSRRSWLIIAVEPCSYLRNTVTCLSHLCIASGREGLALLNRSSTERGSWHDNCHVTTEEFPNTCFTVLQLILQIWYKHVLNQVPWCVDQCWRQVFIISHHVHVETPTESH